MVSSGEIIREHCGHVAVCGSAIEAPPTEKGTEQPTPQGQDASLRQPGCSRGRQREDSTGHCSLRFSILFSGRSTPALIWEWRSLDEVPRTLLRSPRREARRMQVNCSKCSQPIALTDNIESSDGRLAHTECDRPQTLTPEELF